MVYLKENWISYCSTGEPISLGRPHRVPCFCSALKKTVSNINLEVLTGYIYTILYYTKLYYITFCYIITIILNYMTLL